MTGAPRLRRNEAARRPQIVLYAVLSLACFLGALIPIGLLLWKAELLVRLGLTDNFYYFALVLLGLMAASFLFGALRSFAIYSGHHFGGVLELGGPVVAFFLVLLIGYTFQPPRLNFPLTVYVHGEHGLQDLILRDQGFILLDLGGERRRERIQENGQAFFPEIPANFRGKWINVLLDAEGYEMADPGRKYQLEDASLYLAIRKKSARLTGRVQDEAGQPKAGATIAVAGLTTKTDPAGRFDLVIPGDRLQAQLPLQAIAEGYAVSREMAVPGSGELVVVLKPLQP